MQYAKVVAACRLDVDLTRICDGAGAVVGDCGVQLSGGQRARIATARAFYRDADVVLLDDPLLAVDPQVGRRLFRNAVVGLGLGRGKCVVLVTHQHQFVWWDRCVAMGGGRVAHAGSYRECVRGSGVGPIPVARPAGDPVARNPPSGEP